MTGQKLNIIADENMLMAKEIFSSLGEVTLLPGRTMTAEQVRTADVLLVRSVTPVNTALLTGSAVQFVGTATIGTDHIDQDYLNAARIGFSNAPGCNAEAVVDYVISSLFLQGEKQGFDPFKKTIGIIGVGNVGGRLAQRLSAAGCKVLLNDPPRAESETGFVSLETLIDQADIICLHTPLISDGPFPSYHLLNGSNLRQLKQGAVLLNAGRGPVINNTALNQILVERPDITALLDVWEEEPRVTPELAERCLQVSPHIAGYSLDGKVRGTFMLYQALCKHLGIEEAHKLDDFLPKADFAIDNLSQATPLQLMLQVYNPEIDDALLRDTLQLTENSQKEAFDQLRKNYRLRREFSALNVAGHPQADLLQQLGFQLAVNG